MQVSCTLLEYFSDDFFHSRYVFLIYFGFQRKALDDELGDKNCNDKKICDICGGDLRLNRSAGCLARSYQLHRRIQFPRGVSELEMFVYVPSVKGPGRTKYIKDRNGKCTGTVR